MIRVLSQCLGPTNRLKQSESQKKKGINNMPMDFPDMTSLQRRASQRNFRQPEVGETEAQYREAFANFMVGVDRVESGEIRSGAGWDQWPVGMAIGLLSYNKQ